MEFYHDADINMAKNPMMEASANRKEVKEAKQAAEKAQSDLQDLSVKMAEAIV